jgi:hypothetical protein
MSTKSVHTFHRSSPSTQLPTAPNARQQPTFEGAHSQLVQEKVKVGVGLCTERRQKPRVKLVSSITNMKVNLIEGLFDLIMEARYGEPGAKRAAEKKPREAVLALEDYRAPTLRQPSVRQYPPFDTQLRALQSQNLPQSSRALVTVALCGPSRILEAEHCI